MVCLQSQSRVLCFRYACEGLPYLLTDRELPCRRNIEAGLHSNAVGTWSETGNDAAQRTVVYIEHTPPDNFLQAETVCLMLINIVVQQSGNHVMRRGDGMEIACEM